MQLLKRRGRLPKLGGGFTIIELLVVITVIAILASIVVLSYGAVRQKAADSKRNSDLKSLGDAIETARYNTGKPLYEITDGYGLGSWIDCVFLHSGEPKDLSTSTICWQFYYTAIDNIAAAAKVNLDDLKKGDARGNPYIIFEKEGVSLWGGNCNKDTLGYYTGNGGASATGLEIPLSLPECL